MIRVFCLFFFALLWSGISFGQDYFTVQVGTFVDAGPKDFEHIRDLGFLHVQKDIANSTNVFLGGFPTRGTASQMVAKVVEKGFSHAFVKEHFLEEGKIQTLIQFATASTKKPVDWEKFQKVGKLKVILKTNMIKMLSGPYASLDEARTDLERVRNAGYKDAFIKNVNSIFLHEVSEYATGIKKALIPLDIDLANSGSEAKTSSESARKGVPQDYDIPGKPVVYDEPVFDEPESYEYEGVREKPERKSSGLPLPNIRLKVKRKSVLDLQKVLKDDKTYTSSLDGYYGKGTKAGYEKSFQQDQLLQKYLLFQKNGDNTTLPVAQDKVQNAINNLVDEPSGQAVLESSGLPLAKAYEAYMLFSTIGPGSEVNSLMNQAIKGTYANRKYEKRPPFDYFASYAYEDIDQLVLHIFYLHAVPGSNYAAPCWLFDLHPISSADAFLQIGKQSEGDFLLMSCDQYVQWEELRLTQAIAADLNSDKKINGQKIVNDAADRSKLMLTPKALTYKERKALELWHNKLWGALKAWSGKDPLNEKMVDGLELVYLQSQVRLEDYFMDKGFKAADAKGLALKTLKSAVGYHLERFTDY